MSKRRGNGSGKLKDEHRAFLVQRLAVFDTPKEAADALKVEFGAEITAQGVEAYDPGKQAGRRLSERWQTLFLATRERFIDRLNDIPEANKAVRVKRLAHAAQVFEDRGAYMHMAKLLEQIAKEMGSVYSNRREFMGKGGGPIRYAEVDDMTDEQIEHELRELASIPGILPGTKVKH